ncbi:MAG: DUF1959 family protein [Methanocellales archaeon]|nr:DUF1959 family protein [Methanocellales archaeon]
MKSIAKSYDLTEMKRWKLKSYRYQKDVIEPLAKLYKIPKEKLENCIMEKLDMAGLMGIHSRAEQNWSACLEKKVDLDLRLTLLCDALNLISEEDVAEITKDLVESVVWSGKPYEKALEAAKDVVRERIRGILK